MNQWADKIPHFLVAMDNGEKGKDMRSLPWRHNKRDGVSNYQPRDCIFNRLFGRRSKKISKLRVTSLWEGNSPVTDEFPAQKASNAVNVSILMTSSYISYKLCGRALCYFKLLVRGISNWKMQFSIVFYLLVSSYLALRWIQWDLITLVQAKAWCRQSSRYLSQCWPRSMLPCGITSTQWINHDDSFVCFFVTICPEHSLLGSYDS